MTAVSAIAIGTATAAIASPTGVTNAATRPRAPAATGTAPTGARRAGMIDTGTVDFLSYGPRPDRTWLGLGNRRIRRSLRGLA